MLDTVTTADELRKAVAAARGRRLRIGLVPTMGALHAGHISLIEAARCETGFVVVSIFVNPTQFGPTEDLNRYPRPLERDLDMSAGAGADLAFVPCVHTMYPPGSSTVVEVQGLQDNLCGLSRPTHFRGVTTVVLKLFNLVQPDAAYFGQKDAQQTCIIRQMVRDLFLPVEIRVCPIVREADGLAMSSRNVYLTPAQRQDATSLHRALAAAQKLIAKGERNAARVRGAMVAIIKETPGAELDYAEVVNHETLARLQTIQGQVLLALAVRFGGTRLIDNALASVP